MIPPRIILLAGADGFLGRTCIDHFQERGWQVRVFSRRERPDFPPGVEVHRWDGRTAGPWVAALEGVEAVVNLSGRSVNCRYHARNRRKIRESRVASTSVLGAAIAAARQPPRTWINASSATIYRHAEDRAMDEANGEIGTGFSVEVCRAWEAAQKAAATPRTRKVRLRTSMVLGWGGNSVYQVVRRLARWGLGGQSGPGSQFVSWIHVADFCRAVEFLIGSELEGAVNVTAPYPVTNDYLMRTLRRMLGRSIGLPAPRWLLEIGAVVLRTETELVLKSRRVIPARLLQAGFDFRHPTLPESVAALEVERPPG
ncbi:MAG: TIGR01777 family protein [Puniceicoccaceae bacterium]|nr:MAG: TIGR01777 family protein [Puniceicoccaceae bacterium]